jgi:tRNA pseudouridine55 synthase
MARRKKGQPVHGWLILDKEEGLSSNQALGRVRRLLDAQKAGHAGTLDPLATGVLPIAFGEATKTVPFLMDASKAYEFTIVWGAETNTDDREGIVTATSDFCPSRPQIEALLPRFTGKIEQVPPIFSAIKIDGERAYTRARAGEAIEMVPRPVQIDTMSLMEHDEATGITRLGVDCGKGTYVRSLARDIARAAGSAGHVGTLRRTRVGRFTLDTAKTLAKLEEMRHKPGHDARLLDIATVLDDIPALAVDQNEAALLRLGRAIVIVPSRMMKLAEMGIAPAFSDSAVLAVAKGEAVALGHVRQGGFQPFRVFQYG